MKALLPLLFLFSISAIAQINTERLGDLPEGITESSGLLFYQGRLLTHNDSGQQSEIYEIDTLSLELTRTIRINNIPNTDWEDLAEDETYIYIGDIGNFYGDRQDLAIYRIRKLDLQGSDEVAAERIGFSYADQTDFSYGPRSDWDAEAMIVFNGSLIIFTKQWQSQGTRAYLVNPTPGDQITQPIGTYDSQGLITGATVDASNNRVVLLGYSEDLRPFILVVPDLGSNFEFTMATEKMGLPVGFAQAEGLTFVSGTRFLFSSEYFEHPNLPLVLPASLFGFDLENSTEPEQQGEEEEGEEPGNSPGLPSLGSSEELLLFSQPGSKEILFQAPDLENLWALAVYDLNGKRIYFDRFDPVSTASFKLEQVKNAVYYFTFYFRNRILSKPYLVH